MDILDGILSQAGDRIDLEELAGKVGLSAEQLRSGAGSIPSQLAGDGTDGPEEVAVEAANQTGLPLDRLEQLLPQLTQQFSLGDAGR